MFTNGKREVVEEGKKIINLTEGFLDLLPLNRAELHVGAMQNGAITNK